MIQTLLKDMELTTGRTKTRKVQVLALEKALAVGRVVRECQHREEQRPAAQMACMGWRGQGWHRDVRKVTPRMLGHWKSW